MNTQTKGFSLIEIMVVVAILAILASIAYPSYINHIQKTRRADAKQTLLAYAALQERYFFTNNSYATSLINGAAGSLGVGCAGAPCLSADGYYTISLENNPNAQQFFTLTATPTPGTSQATDSACSEFTLTQTGAKVAKKGSTDATATCWGK